MAAAAGSLARTAGAGEPSVRPAIPLARIPLPAGLRDRFHSWFDRYGVVRHRAARGTIWNFYEPKRGRGSWIYPMLSGKAVLWSLHRGRVDEARRFADALLRWQQVDYRGAKARTYGAFPSKLEGEGEQWRRGEAYYAGDNLVIIEALAQLYAHTREFKYLNSAIGAGTWIVSVMCQGHRYGVWAEDHGAPMQLCTDRGDFSNKIYGQVEALWIGSLRRLAEHTAEPSYARQALRAYEFYRRSQLRSGAFMDHYDPGYPPTRYAPSRWQPYARGQLISDNMLRAALGACRAGDLDTARSFRRWLQPEGGAVPAYVDVHTGKSGFENPSDTYYDVVSCGMLRSLSQWLGDEQTAKTAVSFLRRTQGDNGGWHWGIRRRGLRPVTDEQAPIVGMWATADLSVLPPGPTAAASRE